VQRRYVSAPQQEAPPAVPEASAPPPQVVTVNRLPMELPVRRVREHVQRAPDEEPAAASQTAAPQPEAPPPAAAQAPDIDALAEQVYRRLAKQLRIDSYRRGTR